MSTDLLSLALAAAMPLLAFALYAGLRALGDQRARRRGRSRPGERVRATSTSINRPRPAASPSDMARPMDPRPPIGPADPRPTPARIAIQAVPSEPGRRMLAKMQVSRPEPARGELDQPEAARGILAKLPVSRPTDHASGNGHVPIAPLAATDQALLGVGEARSGGTVETTPRDVEQPAPAPASDRASSAAPAGRDSAAPAAPATSQADVGTNAQPLRAAAAASPSVSAPARKPRQKGPGLMSRSLKPFRSALGRGDGKRSSTVPVWPQTEGRDEPFPPLVATAAGPGPCPFCAESRERGAWFCRRCRQPVDPRAVAATSAMNLPTAAPPPPPPSLAQRPGVRPAEPDPLPLAADRPIVRPTQYTPASRASAGPHPAPTSAPADGSSSLAGASPAAAGPASTTAGPTIVRPAAVVARGREPGSNDVHDESRLIPVDADRPAGADLPERATAKAGRRADAKVNLNHATIAELSGLRGIGRVTAQRIVAAREDRAFATVDALVDRKVVGRSVVDRLRTQVTI